MNKLLSLILSFVFTLGILFTQQEAIDLNKLEIPKTKPGEVIIRVLCKTR